MKKILKGLSVALLVVVCMLAFAGCDTSSKIKKAYENEGYTVSTVDKDNTLVKATITSALTADQQKEIADYEIIYAVKAVVNTAVVIKFPSSGDLKKFFTTDDGDTSAYDKVKDNDQVNGNCYLVTYLGGAKDVFKNA
jgi:ABC-type Na+ efflux pump permease subunit